jgi:hypothetical protein
MTIGEVFSKAYELWKRDVLWLVLAGIVIGLIIWAIAVVTGLIVGALAIGSVGLGLSSTSNTFSSVSAGAIFLTIIVGIVAAFLISVLGVTLEGGLFAMVIGAAKENRPVRFGDVFSGFRRFGSYAVFALVVFGIAIGMGILFVTLIGIPVAIALAIWIGIMWLYVMPLIVDQNMTFGDAQRRSREMVKSMGWWRTFGQIILLWVIIFIVDIIVSAIFGGGGGSTGSAKYIAYQFITMIITAVWSTYTVCYISTMYLGSGGAQPAFAGAPTPPPAGGYAMPPAPGFAAPPAPPAAPQTPITPVTPAPVTPAAPTTPDLAAVPPAPPAPEAGTAVTESAGEATSTGQTAATEAAQTAAPEPPEAPLAPTNPPVPPPLT